MNRWIKTLDMSDVFRSEAPFHERRDEMVRRIRALDPLDTDGDLQNIADELAAAGDVDEWDGPWSDFYDWADWNRVWVDTFPKARPARESQDAAFATYAQNVVAS